MGVVMGWWGLEAVANAVVSLAYFAIAGLIVVPLARAHQLRSNLLGTATALIFFSCAVGHGMHAVGPLIGVDGMAGMGMGSWWSALWHTFTAGVGLYYLSLRRYYGRLLDAAPLFDDLAEKRRLADLEQLEAEVNARARAEAERDRYFQMMRAINANSHSLIYVKDLDGRYLMANEACEEVLGLTEAELLGQTDELTNPRLANAWRATDVQARQGRYRVEEYGETPEGPHYYDSVKFPLFDADGKMYATCGVSLDITELKRTNAALADARDAALSAAAAKSAFLATMSHEIRTPMNAVIGMTDLLLDTDLDEQQHDFVDTVRASGDALLVVIDDILDFSKIESGELQLRPVPFSLGHEVERAADLVAAAAAAKGLDLVCYVDDSCPRSVIGDRDRLRQILVNLLSNAVKFTPVGDVLVSVKAAPVSDGRLLVTADVTDTGIGISAEGVEKLFHSFTQVDQSSTRSFGGTGLGLAISRRLAQAMDGNITVTSRPDRGSTFTVTVLLATDPNGDPLTSAPLPEVAGRTVLIVDDNPTNLRILDLQLSGLQMITTPVVAPADAIELVRRGRSFDAAVLDLHMPEMDGLQLRAELTKVPTFAATPVVLLSSVGVRPTGEEPQLTVITKPVKRAALAAALAAALLADFRPRRPDRQQQHLTGPSPHPLRVLLVEDNLVNQRVAQLMLHKLGHPVDTVDNGLDAVDAVATTDYDVVLMDIQMPKLDGLQATRRIRAELPAHRQPHIIAMTASAMLEDHQACTAAGMESYLTKPVRAASLEQTLDRVNASLRRVAVGARSAEQGHPSPEAVDLTVIERLRMDLDDTTGAAVQELIDTYLVSAETLIPDLTAALEAGDADVSATLAHALASSTSLLGATRLADLLHHVQTTAHDKLDDLPGLAPTISTEAARVTADLRSAGIQLG